MKAKFRNLTRNKYMRFAIQVVAIMLGCFIMGLGYSSFYLPNSITPSGFFGLATIFSTLFARADIIISPSIIYILMNVILFFIALRFFGWKFTLLTIIGVASYSLASDYASIPSLTSNDALLSALLGGAFMGCGVGIVMRFGGSTGGSDIVALLINKYKPNFKTGTCSFVVNVIVLILSILVYGMNSTLYAIISIFVSGRLTDFMLNGTKSARAYYIICDKDEEIASAILKTFQRGVTRINVEGVFSNKQKKMLVVLIANHQAPHMKEIVKQIDPRAFVYSTGVREALGESMFMKEEKMYEELKLSSIKKFFDGLKKHENVDSEKIKTVACGIIKVKDKKLKMYKNKKSA